MRRLSKVPRVPRLRSFYEIAKRVLLPAGVTAVAVASMAAANGCGPAESEIRAKRRVTELEGQLRQTEEQRASLEGRLNEIQQQASALAQQVRDLGGNVEQLRTERGALASEVEAARAREEELRRRQEQAASRLKTFRDMLTKFRSLIQTGRLRVRPVRNRMVIELPEGVLFESAQAEIKPEGRTALRQVAQVLATIRGRDYLVAGHTDDRPIRTREFPSNWELSTARALNVVKFLRENGVSPRNLSAAGFAEFSPAGDNNTEEGRAQNRRIEIVLMPNLDELPDLSQLEQQAQ